MTTGMATGRVITLSVLALTMAALAIASMAIARDSVTINGDDDLTAANGVTGGSGTQADPFIIEGLNITGTERQCIYINYTESHIIIKGMNLSQHNRTYTGIYLEHVTNVTVRDMTFYNLTMAVEARWCEDITIERVTAIRGALQFSWSHGIIVDDFSFEWYYSGSQATITVYESTNASITNCTFEGSETAIRLSDADHVRVLDNHMRDLRYGISSETRLLNFNEDLMIENNTIINFSSTAISLTYVKGLGLANNTVIGKGYFYDILVYGRDLRYIRDNTMENGGIRLGSRFPEEGVGDFRNNLIRGREILYLKGGRDMDIPLNTHQVILWNCSDCSIKGPYAGSYRPTFTLLYSSNISISDLDVEGEHYDLVTNLVNGVRVRDCSFKDVDYGLWMTDCTDVVIGGCEFLNCSSGVVLNDCSRVRIDNCTFTGCSAGIGESLYLMYGPGNLIVVEDNTFRDCRDGIGFESLSDAVIIGNEFENSTNRGIYIDYGNGQYPNTNVTIAGNTFLDCTTGIEVWRLRSFSIRGNVIEGSGAGLKVVFSEGGTVSMNRVSNSSKNAIEISSISEDVLVKGNIVENSYRYGIMVDATGCRIYLNDFINNSWGYNASRQAYDRWGNQWDDQRMGNYWDDYPRWYPDATNDGTVWSEPYDVSWGGQYFDNFPLVHRFDLEPPVADGGGNRTVEEGTRVTLDGTGSRDNRGIVRYEWTFIYDDTFRQLNGPTVGFSFMVPGQYRVELTVYDAMDNEDTDVIWLTVTDMYAPVVELDPEVVAEQFTVITFDGSGCQDSGGIANYTWTVEWVDGPLVLHGRYPLLYCSHAGTFDVTLRATDRAGHWAEGTLTLVVLDRESPVANIGPSYTVDQGRNLHLDASNCTDNVAITVFTWTLASDGGKETAEGVSTTFTWSVPGDYSCTLTLRDRAGNENVTRFLVTVMDTEPPRIENPGDMWTDIGTPYRFPALSITDNVGVARLEWSFVDGGRSVVSNESRPTHTFASPGTYPVTLAVWDASGNRAAISFDLTVIDPNAPVARAGEDRLVSVGTTVTLSGATSTDNDGIERYLWNFRHDGTDHALEGVSVRFVFTEVGAHTVTLTVWDLSGNNATDTVVITVADTVPPKALITVPTRVAAGTEVTFRGDDSEDNVAVVNWTWTFEHNGTDVVLFGTQVTFVFHVPGTYTVTLTVRDGKGLEGQAEVDIWVTEGDTVDNGGDGDGGTTDWLPVAVLAVLIIVPLTVIGAYLLVKRRQGPGGDDGVPSTPVVRADDGSEWEEYQ